MPSVAIDNHAAKAKSKFAEKVKLTRMRVCAGCVKRTDMLLGGVHSEKPCERCQAKPCVGAIVMVTDRGGRGAVASPAA